MSNRNYERRRRQYVYLVPYDPLGGMIGEYLGALLTHPLRTIKRTILFVLFVDAMAFLGFVGVVLYTPETREILFSELLVCAQIKPCFKGAAFEKRHKAITAKHKAEESRRRADNPPPR
jgi:hypothetical protein